VRHQAALREVKDGCWTYSGLRNLGGVHQQSSAIQLFPPARPIANVQHGGSTANLRVEIPLAMRGHWLKTINFGKFAQRHSPAPARASNRSYLLNRCHKVPLKTRETGKEQHPNFHNTGGGLSETEVERMRQEAELYADEDISAPNSSNSKKIKLTPWSM